MDWVSYLTVLLLVAFASLTVFSSMKHWIAKKKSTSLLLSSFDLKRNISHFNIRKNENLNILDGVRALAMMWVVFGHTYFFYLFIGVENSFSLPDVARHPYFLVVEAGLFSVDVFFMLGGFFLACIMLR